MKVTEIKLRTGDWGNLKAYVSITFDKSFVVTGLKIIEGSKGLFVGMPSQKGSDGEYRDIAFPVTKELRSEIQNAVLNKYKGNVSDVEKAFEEVTTDDLDDGFPFK